MTRQGDPGAPLSAVQLQVLGWIADGMSVPQIAAEHHYSPDTIKSHLVRIYRQLGASNAAHAVHIAHQRGLLGGTADETPRRAA